MKPPHKDEVYRTLQEAVDEERFLSLDRQEIYFTLDIEENDYTEGFVLQDKSNTTIDEIAFFIAKDDCADRLYEKLETYVAESKTHKKEWLESYNPSEAIKLKNGRLFRYQNSMGYAFLNESELHGFLSELDKIFKGSE